MAQRREHGRSRPSGQVPEKSGKRRNLFTVCHTNGNRKCITGFFGKHDILVSKGIVFELEFSKLN